MGQSGLTRVLSIDLVELEAPLQQREKERERERERERGIQPSERKRMRLEQLGLDYPESNEFDTFRDAHLAVLQVL